MSRNATASWSGYAHQGKIGLLIALRRINSLHGTNSNLAEYSLEYETQEDAKISHQGSVLEVHQVKAYTAASTIGSYTEALMAFESCAGQNYLHSICEITNWNNLSSAQNPSLVDRYPYTTAYDYCPLDAIDSYIDSEIFTLLSNRGHQQSTNNGWRENAFQEFLATLDEKIRFEHQHHNLNTYNINFTLLEISDIIISPPAKFRSKLWAIRKKLYEQYLTFIDHLELNAITLTIAHEQNVENAIRAIWKYR